MDSRILLLLPALLSSLSSAAEPERLLLWPQGAPGARGSEEADRPSLSLHLPPRERAVGTAVVVCPGGGYGFLAVEHEGREVAEWLNSFGVTAFILRYRIAPRYRHPAPLDDARRAVRTVRARAEEWGLDPGRIGILGFSAGGHLASSAGTQFEEGNREAADPVERVSSRPDFMVLVYPVISFTAPYTHQGSRDNLLGKDAAPELLERFSSEKQVTPRTPPAFLIHTGGDRGVPPENSIAFYLAMRAAGVPAELHLYEKGEHGFGLGRKDPVLSTWPERCRAWMGSRGLLGVRSAARGDDWPQWLGPRRDGVWRETGIIEKFPPQGPPVRWRTPIGQGYAGPAVAGGRVYVLDRTLPEGTTAPADPFQRGSIPGAERVLCLDQEDGRVLWQHAYECAYTVSYPSGPRATPLVEDGKLYTLGAEGHLFCFEAPGGRVLWSRELKKDYRVEAPLWGFSAHPLLDSGKLICLVGGEGSVAVAFEAASGKELWRALSAREPGYSPPMIYEAGGKRQLIIWHPEAVNSLDPETGRVWWSQPFKVQSGLCIAAPRKLGDLLLVTSFYNGPMMLRLDSSKPGASVLWRGDSDSEKKTDKLHAIMCTPHLEEGHIYGVCSYGQLRCLRADTGERLWETLAPTGATGERGGRNDRWANAFIVKNGDRFILPNERGELVIARLSPRGYEEVSRARILEPTASVMGRGIVWSHPAFADRCVFARNDREIVCVSLAVPAVGSPTGSTAGSEAPR